MIITISGIKGGTGKSLIATNLTATRALANDKILLVDADDQCTASEWVEHREGLGIETPWTTIKLTGASVRSQVLKLKEHYDHVIIDTGGRDTDSQRAALSIADILIAPFQPRTSDIWTLRKVIKLIKEFQLANPKLQPYAILSRADSQGSDNEDTIQAIQNTEGIEYLPTPIGQRKAFCNAFSLGYSVMEMKGSNADKKAQSEMLALSNAIFTNILLSV